MSLHARGMYESQASIDSPYLASRAFRMLSEIAQTEGRYADAENESRRSVDLARQSRSTHASGEFNLAESLSALCQTLDSRGYFDNALQVGQEQRTILEELCTKEPENLAHRRELGIALNNVGRVLEKKGDNDGALALFSKSQAISDELCTKEPENLAHRRELGIACFWVGKMLANLSRWQESAEAFEQAMKATQAVIDAGGSFGSLKGNLDAMTSWLQHVRDQINKK
jgi:tetratricopeptide (TPR) repeat protein